MIAIGLRSVPTLFDRQATSSKSGQVRQLAFEDTSAAMQTVRACGRLDTGRGIKTFGCCWDDGSMLAGLLNERLLMPVASKQSTKPESLCRLILLSAESSYIYGSGYTRL